MPPDLNNCKACPRSRIDRPEVDFRDCRSSLAEMSELGNGDDPVLVPNRRQDRMEQPRQGAAWRPGRQSVEFGYSRSAEGNGNTKFYAFTVPGAQGGDEDD